MSQELEIRTARCEEDSTDRMLQELETVTARWDEDRRAAEWGAKFEKKHGHRLYIPLEFMFEEKIKRLRGDVKAFDRSASPKTKRERLSILAKEKEEVEDLDLMLLSGDESDKEEAACSGDPDTEWYTDELPKEEAASAGATST